MPFNNGHALLIGVGAYRSANYLDVSQTARDVAALAAVLQDVRFCGYPPSQILPLLQNETATIASVLTGLDDLARRTRPEDTVLLFYAGHGHQGTDGSYYLTTHDTQFTGMEVRAGSGIAMATLLAKIQAIPAQRLLFLCNACYAGRLPPDLALSVAAAPFVTPLPPKDAQEALLSAGKGRIAITACGRGQESQTGEGEITLFTQAVVEALQGYGVANHSGFISVFDLYEHVYNSVKEQAAARGKQQEPELTIIQGAGAFPVALYKGACDTGVFAPAGELPAVAAVNSVTKTQSQRSLRIYLTSVAKTITASGQGAVAAETIGGSAYGGVNTYGQVAVGSGIAQAAGPGASATVSYAGGSSGTLPGGRAEAVALLQALLLRVAQATAAGRLDADTAAELDYRLKKTLAQLQKPSMDRQAVAIYLAEAQNFAAAGSDPSLIPLLAAVADMLQRVA